MFEGCACKTIVINLFNQNIFSQIIKIHEKIIKKSPVHADRGFLYDLKDHLKLSA